MAWTIKLREGAQKDLKRLDREVAKRILRFLFEKLSTLEDPRMLGESLKGPKFGQYWKHRVGDYRIISEILDTQLIVEVVSIGHRREIYR
jgi:mRNA interferase RelE/StbE